MVQATVNLNIQAILAQITAPGGIVEREMLNVGQLVVNRARVECPVDTGRLRQSINSVIFRLGTIVGVRVGTDVNYAATVHNGHKEIKPVNGKVLHFKVGGKDVFVTRVRATAGVPFLSRAIRAVIPGANVPDKLE